MAGYLEFWGVNVPPRKEVSVDLRGHADTHFVHVTNLALGPDAPDGPHTVVLRTGGKVFTLVTLGAGGATQYKTDTVISEAASFAHNGPGVVNITGYRAMLPGMPDMPEGYVDGEALSDVEEGEEEEEESGSEEEDDDSDEAPGAVPIDSALTKKRAQVLQMGNGKAHRFINEKDEDYDSDESEDLSDEDMKQTFDDDSEDSEDDEDIEDSEDSDMEASGHQQMMKKRNIDTTSEPLRSKKQRVDVAGKEAAANRPTPGKGRNAPVEGPASNKTPKKQPEKKVKATPAKQSKEKPSATPATATPGANSTQGTPKEQDDFKKKVVNALKASGPLSLETLGPKVSPKPKFVKKLGKFLAQYPDTFVLEAGAVKLK
ncbi:unnamed protein product [Ostreobium quekettii]|uniref:Nucleoplasmin-like domain-containing protein n=1 Tax=Ostreobium quekettii TaxID=121088 RepID=A0A8S1J2G3_9CHLO|nr:unnamed protein product [Ostreobium quekettii]